MADKKATIRKTTPPSEWFKNVAKSVGYSTSDIVRDITPGIHSLIADNVSYGKELAENTREALKESQSMVSMFSLDNQVKIGQDALKNAIDDIRTGKIYNKERMESYSDDDFSEFMSEFEDGFSDSSSKDENEPTIINNTKIVKEDNPKLLAAVENTAITNLKSAEAMMKHSTRLHSNKATMDHKLAMSTLKGLESINENIGQLVNFQNDSMSKYVAASIKYYDESLGVMKNSLDKLIAMVPEKQDPRVKSDPFEDVFNGGSFSFEGYFKNVKSNFGRMKDTNLLLNFVSRVFEDKDTLEFLARSPLQFISNAITKQVVPMTIRATMEQLDKSVTEFFPAMLNKLTRMSRSNNPIFELIGGLFGIETSTKTSPNMANYMRGAIPFDGETKRAITDVIPTYLRKIYSHISGSKEIAFDWEKGTWGNVDSMKSEYDKAKLQEVTNAYSNQYSQFMDFMQDVRFQNEKERKDFQEGIEKFLYNLARSDEHIKFDNTRESRRAVNNLHDFGSNRQMQELFYGMLTNLDRADQVNLVGAGRYKALENVDKFFRNIENNPTIQNAMTILSGMDIDEQFEKNADGKVIKRKSNAFGSGSGRVDKFGNDDLFYLRGIMGTLLEGIKVFPFSHKGSKRGKDTGNHLDNRYRNFKSQKVTTYDSKSTKFNQTLQGEELDTFDSRLGIDLSNGREYDYQDRLAQIKKSRRDSERASNKDTFGDTIGSILDNNQEKYNRVRRKLDDIVRKPADVLEAAFQKIDETLYNVVFGIKNDGRGSFMDLTLEKMQDMFSKVGEFAIEKVFLPIGDFLGTTGKKAVDAAKNNPIINAVKDGVKYWFVGDKDETTGKRTGGVFSEIMNSAKDTAKAFNHSITGAPYKDSNGRTYDKNEDSFFNGVKNLVKDIYDSSKLHFFGDKNSPDKDKQRGALTIVTDTLGEGMADWSNILFGKERDKTKSGTQILKENTTTFVKNVPRGAIGMLGGAAVGSVLSTSLGLIGSLFLPGAPVAMAMIGGALGMATGFEGFNNWAFGEIGGNGKRIGGALLSYNQKEFLKNNKNTLIGGAIAGVVLSSLGKTVIDGIIPGAGAIMDFLSPFGPIGAAMQGMATAMIMKSTAVMDWLFGAKNVDGARMGGMIQRLFKKPNMEISKKAVGNKAGLMAVGAVGGSLLGSVSSSFISSFGLIPALLATPLGPVSGAILGLSAAIALSSDKVRKFLFGSYDETKDKNELGIIGKSFNMMKIEFIEPLMRTFSSTIQHTLNWFSNNYMAKLQFAVEPIIKTFVDSAKGMFKLVKGAIVDLPVSIFKFAGSMIGKVVGNIRNSVGDAINEKIVMPVGKLFGALVATPIRKMNELLFRGIFSVARGINNIGASLLMVPAAMKMTFDQTVAGAKSLFRGIAGIFKKDDSEEGQTLGGRLRRAFDPRRIYADMKSDPSASYVDRLNNTYNEKMENYRARREEIKARKKAADADWKAARNAARSSNYNNLGGENDSLARIIHSTNRKGINNRDQIAKLQSDVFKHTGLTINELLGLNPDDDVTALSKNQLKAIQGMIKTSTRVGKTGQDLKDHLGITEYQRSQEESVRGILDNVKDMATNMEDMSKHISDLAKGNAKLLFKMDQDGDGGEVVITSSNSEVFSSTIENQIDKIYHGNRPESTSSDESVGGAVLGSLFSSMRSTVKGVFNSIGKFTSDELNEIGCGPIVLAMAMAAHGVKVDPKTIFEYAIRTGLVNDGVGVSSDIFKMYGGNKGFVVEFAKPTASNLENLFRNNKTVIARMNTGAGHFVLLRGYDPSTKTVSVKDPMKQFGGRTDVSTIIKYITHLYGIRKKSTSSNSLSDVKDIQNKVFGGSNSRRNVASSTSIGGSVAGISEDSSILNSVNTITVKGIDALPVFIVRTREEEAHEEDMFKQLASAIGAGGSDGGSGAYATGNSSYNPSGTNRRRTGLNRINTIIDVVTGLFNIGRNTFNRARNTTRDDISQAFGRMRDSAVGGYRNAKTNTMVTSAQGPYAMLGALLSGTFRAVGKIGRVTTRAVRSIGGGGTGQKIMNALIQAGNTSSRANLDGMRADYATAATPQVDVTINPNAPIEDQIAQLNKHRNVNNFLRQKAEQASAQALANFQTTEVDLSTRIEINTRYIAQRVDDLFDLTKKFFDWLKPFLENLDFCCDKFPFGGGGGFTGGGGFFGAAPVVTNKNEKKYYNNNNDNDKNIYNTTTTGPVVNNDNRKYDQSQTTTNNTYNTYNTPVTTVPVIGVGGNKGNKGNKNQKNTTDVNKNKKNTALPQDTTKKNALPDPNGTSNKKVKDAMTGEYKDLPKSKGPILDAEYEVIDDSKVKNNKLPTPDDPTVKKKDTVTKKDQKYNKNTSYLDQYLSTPEEERKAYSDYNKKEIEAFEYQEILRKRMKGEISVEEAQKQINKSKEKSKEKVKTEEKVPLYSFFSNKKDSSNSPKKKSVFSFIDNESGIFDPSKLMPFLNKDKGSASVAEDTDKLESSDKHKFSEILSKNPNVGKNITKPGGDLAKATAKVEAVKAADKLVAKVDDSIWGKIAKSGGKTLTKFLGGAASGGVVTAGMTAMDGKYGYDNAASILKKDPDKIDGFDRAGAATAAAVVGFVPLIDLADDLLGGYAKQGIGNIVAGTKNVIDQAGKLWNSTQDAVVSGWNSATEAVGGVVNNVVDVTKDTWNSASEAVGDAWNTTKDTVGGVVDNVVDVTVNTWNSASKAVGDAWNGTTEAVGGAVDNVIKGTTSVWDGIVKTVTGGWNETNEQVGEKSGSIVGVTKNIWDLVSTTVSKAWNNTDSEIKTKAQGIVDKTSEIWEKTKTSAGAKWETFKDSVLTKATNIKDAILKPIGEGESEADSAFKGFTDTLGTLVSGLTGTIKGKIEEATSFVKSLFGQGKGNKDIVNKDVDGIGGASILDSQVQRLNKEIASQSGTFGKGTDDVYYSQNDPRWANTTFAGGTTFGDAGCGPTAVANVVTSMTGERVLPTDALEFAQKKDMVDPARGTSSSLFASFGASKGVPIYESTATTDNVVSQLAKGNKLILRGENGPNYTDAGHFIVADGLTPDGKVIVKDPISKGRSGEINPEVLGKGLTNAFVATSTDNLPNLSKGKTFGKGSGFSNPVKGATTKDISSRYGWRTLSGVREFHYGVDIAKSGLVNIQAAADGEVVFAGPKGTYGNVVIIKHTINGKRMDSVYAHLRDGLKVAKGATVKQGQNIGYMGTTGRSTGQHLHFEIHDGEYKYGVNNVNPEPYIFTNGDPTPEGFDGILATGVTAATMLAGATGMINNDPMSKLNSISFIPDAITKLPETMKNISNSLLFGMPMVSAAATLAGNSSSSDVDTTFTSETIKSFKDSKKYQGPYADIINKYAEQRNLEPALLAAIIKQESNFNPNAVSSAGAQGLMQLMPSTAKSLGVSNPFDPDNNVMGGSSYIRQQINSFKDLGLALAAYNAGPGNVKKYGGIPPFEETQNYVSKVINNLKNYRSEFGGGLGGGTDSILNGDLDKNNIYNIMKSTQGSNDIVDLNKVNKVNIDEFASVGGPSLSDAVNIRANSRIEDISYENDRYTEFKTNNDKVYAAGPANNVTTYVDSWSQENIERVINALENIASNTADTKENISTMNNYVTNNVNNLTTQSDNVKKPAGFGTNEMSPSYVKRNKQILSSRK